MKKIIILIVTIILITSCNNQPECSSAEVKRTLFSIVKEQLVKEYKNTYFNQKWDYSSLRAYSKDNGLNQEDFLSQKRIELNEEARIFAENAVNKTKLELDAVRLLEKEEELKKCKCVADLVVDREESNKIEYTAQLTEDNKVYVELFY